MKIFILHTRRTAYGVIRCLASQSCEIFGADTIQSESSYSRYMKNFFLIPEMTESTEEQFLSVLISLAKRMDYEKEKPIVFTAKDGYLLFFAKHIKTLSEYFIPSFETDYEMLVMALDKAAVAQVALEHGVLTPRSYRLDDFISPEANIKFPVIIKPAIKNRPDIDVVNRAFRIKLCQNFHDLQHAARLLEDLQQPYVIQEYIEGGDDSLYTCGVYCYQGRLIAWSTSRKIRQFPPNIGECSLGETIYIPALVQPSETLIKAIGLSGILQIEYKRSGNQFYLIEINPRIWSWHEINRYVGVNLVTIAVDVLLGRKKYIQIVKPEQKRRIWMFLMMDILHNAILNRNVSIMRCLIDWVRSDVEAFFNILDPKPFIMHINSTIPYMRSIIRKARNSEGVQ
jgi:predicted ATP-grasp superfamily ATP-dependent carboligase